MGIGSKVLSEIQEITKTQTRNYLVIDQDVQQEFIYVYIQKADLYTATQKSHGGVTCASEEAMLQQHRSSSPSLQHNISEPQTQAT